MNKAILIGRVGKDPERFGESGVKFSLATNESWVDSTGEKRQITDWHTIIVNRPKVGDVIMKYVKKGDELGVSGRIRYNKHEDRYYTNIILDEFHFVGGSKNSGSTETSSQSDNNTHQEENNGDDYDDLPF